MYLSNTEMYIVYTCISLLNDLISILFYFLLSYQNLLLTLCRKIAVKANVVCCKNLPDNKEIFELNLNLNLWNAHSQIGNSREI